MNDVKQLVHKPNCSHDFFFLLYKLYTIETKEVTSIGGFFYSNRLALYLILTIRLYGYEHVKRDEKNRANLLKINIYSESQKGRNSM
jgi:hypothetical protein